MKIEFKATGVFDGDDEIQYLLIDDVKQSNAVYKPDTDGFIKSEDLLAEDLINRLYKINCSDFPNKLKTACYTYGKPVYKLLFGEISEIGLGRDGGDFIIRLCVLIDDKEKSGYYINPPMLLQHAVEIANRSGMVECKYNSDVEDFPVACFNFRSNTNGYIGMKIEEGKKLLNDTLQEAAKEIHNLIGQQF